MTWCFEFHTYNMKAVDADFFQAFYPSHPRLAFDKTFSNKTSPCLLLFNQHSTAQPTRAWGHSLDFSLTFFWPITQ